ncbi:beta-defensin 110 [Octodon degus]|uniref:Beta-defensin n=1 Tax=Octodon degus TaxID=10160 RepID=A0A6P3EYQ7_OCTDE|nr:beta-defensin 110 [Octodon degus]
MKFHLFFFILLFGVTVLPAKRRYPEYGSLDLRKECQRSKGVCRALCLQNEIRVTFCIRPGSQCCMSSSG